MSTSVLPYSSWAAFLTLATAYCLEAVVSQVPRPVAVSAAAETHFLIGKNLRFKSVHVIDSEEYAVRGPLHDVRVENKCQMQLVHEV